MPPATAAAAAEFTATGAEAAGGCWPLACCCCVSTPDTPDHGAATLIKLFCISGALLTPPPAPTLLALCRLRNGLATPSTGTPLPPLTMPLPPLTMPPPRAGSLLLTMRGGAMADSAGGSPTIRWGYIGAGCALPLEYGPAVVVVAGSGSAPPTPLPPKDDGRKAGGATIIGRELMMMPGITGGS